MTPRSATRFAALILALATADTAREAAMAPQAAANVDHGVSRAHYERAKGYFEQGKLRDAGIELKNALRKNPEDADARLLLGKIALLGGDLEGAEKEIARSLSLRPDDEAAVLLGEVYIQKQEPERALGAVAGKAGTTEMQIQRLVIAGTAQVTLERYDAADRSFRDILTLDPGRVEGHFGIARVHAARGDFTRAATKIDEIVAARPDYGPAWMLKGEIALMSGDRSGAVRAFDNAAERDPNNPMPVISRARANLAAGNITAAKADSQILRQNMPDAPMTHYILAAIAFAEGDYEGANQRFTQLQRHFDEFAPAVLLGALIKNQRNELNQADALLMKYISMEPDNLDARRALAQVRLKMGNSSNAVDILERLAAKTPDDMPTRRRLASAYIALDRFEKARDALQRIAARGTPEQAEDARNVLAMLDGSVAESSPELRDTELRIGLLKATDSLMIGNTDLAARQIAQLKPKYEDTASVLAIEGGLAAARGDTVAARKLLDTALERDPELYAAIVASESLDRDTGTPRASIERLQVLLNRAPQSEFLTLRLADKLAGRGDSNAAIAVLQQQAATVPGAQSIRRALVSRLLLAERRPEAIAEAARMAADPAAGLDAVAFATAALVDLKAGEAALPAAERLRELATDSVRATALHAEALALAGRRGEAYRVLDEAQTRWPDEPGIAVTYVNLAVEAKDAEAANTAIARLARRDPATAARLRARALSALNQPVVAVEVLEAEFARAPTSALATALFSARRRAGRNAAAFDGLRSWTERHADDRAALVVLATGLMETGQDGEAERSYGRFLQLEPGNPVALNNYAWLRHRAGRADALDYAQRAYRAAPGSPEIADTFGYMLVEYGKLADGLKILARASDGAPDNPEIAYHYAWALSKAGKLQQARTVLSAALSMPGEFSDRQEAEALLATLR